MCIPKQKLWQPCATLNGPVREDIIYQIAFEDIQEMEDERTLSKGLTIFFLGNHTRENVQA